MGHGEGYNLFHVDGRHETARKVLNGTLEQKHPMEEINRYIDNLKKAHGAESLQEEDSKINAPITTAEFQCYFRRKQESTELSPSGWHIGHYKAILDYNDLVDMVVAMLNIGLTTGTSLKRWQQAISFMLEKDKGSPKLH